MKRPTPAADESIPVDPRRFPRPNLDPISYPPPEPITSLTVVAGIAAVAITGLVLLANRRTRLARKSTATALATAEVVSDPRQRLAQLSQKVRQSLADRLGSGWTSLTTEEIAQHADFVNDPQAERLITFLRAADHAKFADDDVPESLEPWESWVSTWLKTSKPPV